MAITKVDLLVSDLIAHLEAGMTWLKSEDLGYGSIQEKYGAKDPQIEAIRKHPKLKDIEPTAVLFTVIDDTKKVEPAEVKAKPADVKEAPPFFKDAAPQVTELHIKQEEPATKINGAKPAVVGKPSTAVTSFAPIADEILPATPNPVIAKPESTTKDNNSLNEFANL